MAFFNVLFREFTLPPMHDSVKRLLEFAREATAGTKSPIETFVQLTDCLDVSSAVMTNWKARGISKSGALLAEARLGCSAVWVLTGTGSKFSVAEEVGNFFRQGSEPPGPPLGITDRHQVSDSDWALLEDVKMVLMDDELETIRRRAAHFREKQRETLERIASAPAAPTTSPRK